MRKLTFDPDVTQHDNAAYWAGALILALQAGDKERAGKARRNLRRLGYDLHSNQTQTCRKGRGAK